MQKMSCKKLVHVINHVINYRVILLIVYLPISTCVHIHILCNDMKRDMNVTPLSALG